MQAFRWSGLALRAAFGVVVAAGLASCGSGAVSGGSAGSIAGLALTPSAAVAYSELPTTFSITGGSGSYSLLSSNQAVIPAITNLTSGNFNVIPLDVSADTPVTLTVLDNTTRATATANLTVKARTISNTVTVTPSAGQSAACGASVCSGGDAEIRAVLAQGGVAIAGRPIQFDLISGDLQFITSASTSTSSTETLANSALTTTDSTGTARIRVRAGSILTAETAIVKITDVASGFSQTAAVSIAPASGATLTVVPATIQFTGNSTTTCANGVSADVVVIGGRPPYQVTKPAGFNVNPTVLTFSGGHITITSTGQCARTSSLTSVESGQIMSVVDSNGASSNVLIHNDPAPVTSSGTFSVSPETVTLDSCQAGANVLLVGGTGFYYAATGSSAVSATVALGSGYSYGNITRAPNNATASSPVLVAFSDGQTAKTVTVTLSGTAMGKCP